jgi:hypothetical protein
MFSNVKCQKDKRQKFVKVSLAILNKLLETKEYDEEQTFIKQIFPFETFVLLNASSSYFCTVSTYGAATLNITILEYYYFHVCLFLNTELNSVFVPLELIFIKFPANDNKKIFSCSLFIHCFFKFTNLNLKFSVLSCKVASIAGIYAGFC